MAGHAGFTSATQASLILREVWDSQFALDPSEEAIVAPLVAEPVGVQKIGKKLHLRKIANIPHTSVQTIGTPATSSTTLASDSLTYYTNNETEVTVTPTAFYTAIELNPDALNQIIDDGNAIAGWRKQMLASLDEKIDYQLLQLASDANQSEASASFDDPTWRAAVAKLAKYAKRKFRIGKTPYNLILHPDVLAQALNVSALKEYQIRGSAGSATSGQLVTTYGANIEESGLVKNTGGVKYNPLFIQDAWCLGWNQKPKMLESQMDGLVMRFICYTEFGVAEWFDSSIVSVNIS
jgi:hypothetical protein